MLLAFWSIYIHLFSTIVLASTNDTDHLALLEFKKSISGDPFGIFLSWNVSTHFCNWHGITCNLQRVTGLNMNGCKLKGPISPHVGNLSYMRNFNLANNSFYGKIPQELGKLSQLQQIRLQNNSLVGEIPTNLTGCNDLRILLLYGNNLIGEIPAEIGLLYKLQSLMLDKNQLTGGFPSFIGNLSSLTELWVSSNNLMGSIPREICHLKRLTILSLNSNKLSGTIPSCVYNFSSLTGVSAGVNDFSGSLPPNMFDTLPNLQAFSIDGNQISGTIPPSISNASALSEFSIGDNHFTGQVPSLGKLQDLRYLALYTNHLGSNSTNGLDFVHSLTNCSKLQVLFISYNNFGGKLPSFLGNLSTGLQRLYIGGNQLSGEIPATLGNLVGLFSLTMERNRIEGIIPETFGKFHRMQELELSANRLSGEIGSFIGNLSQLYFLGRGMNMLEGNIPPSIGNCQNLQHLALWQNNLRGTIPVQIFNLSSLTELLALSENTFSGSIPVEVGNLKNLDLLDMSENHLSGGIPETMGECIMLEHLFLQGNSLQGIIPSSFASLRSLQELDLSRNNLSGSIPNALQNFSFLEYLNVSYNMLHGMVPTEGVFRNASGLVVTGNLKLCGGISELHLPPCPVKKGNKIVKHHKFKLIAGIVSVVAFLLILSIILLIYWMRKSKKPSMNSPTIDQLAKVSYQSIHNATGGFSATNLIGSGNFSFVYKGTLELGDKVVAIKVLNLQRKGAHKTFIAECNALRNIKHRNLVQTLTCCSSTDYKGQEFKALIFEYMTNGSLEQWLHPRTPSAENQTTLNIDQRLSIMIDVASALHYLHYECEQTIIHCDLKPSNVLLDDDMVAHVSDFGIARLISTINGTTTSKQTSTIGIKGTVGYAPPGKF